MTAAPPLPRHHPPEDLLAEHAAGTLPEPVDLVVATHLAYCPQCSAAVADYEAVGGALLEELPPADLAAGSLEGVLARLDAGDAPPHPASAARRPPADPFVAGLPPALRRALGNAPAIRWRPVLPGVVSDRMLPRTTPGYRSRLIKVRPGRRAPEHGHFGTEFLLVLDGKVHQGGDTLTRGDLHIADPGVRHDTLSDPEVGCTCLLVLSGPIRLKGALAVLNLLRIY
jgi:putative transcriptional regulator